MQSGTSVRCFLLLHTALFPQCFSSEIRDQFQEVQIKARKGNIEAQLNCYGLRKYWKEVAFSSFVREKQKQTVVKGIKQLPKKNAIPTANY